MVGFAVDAVGNDPTILFDLGIVIHFAPHLITKLYTKSIAHVLFSVKACLPMS